MDLFAQVTLLSAGAVLVAEEILKLKAIPVGFANRYPVFTNIALSIIAAFVAVWQSAYQPHGVSQWLVFIGLVSLVAAMAYNHVISNSETIKKLEG